jgi:MarR family transcriptional regulator, organic hydroperoxide resistance regulator
VTKNSSSLQRELRQSKPFRSAYHEGAVAIMRTADVLKRRNSFELAAYGITGQQYNVLRILRGAGAKGLPTLAIGERMIEAAPGLSRLVERLQKKGLLKRERSKLDRREVVCRITPAGLDLLERLDPLIAAAEDRWHSHLTKGQAEELCTLLEKVRLAVETDR